MLFVRFGGHVQRRAFITLFGSAAAAWPLAIRAQQRIRRVVVLMGTGDDLQGQSWITAFRQKLQELGRTDGHDIKIEVIWGGGDIEHIRASAADLVSSKPDVILVYSVSCAE
jgi:putative ABC transport system substrate-binding protein